MKKSDNSEQVISRRKALGRIGLFATAAYTVPAFATLSMAHASSNASSSSDASGSSNSSSSSDASSSSNASTPSGASSSDVEEVCGVENPDATPEEAAVYTQCVIDVELAHT